jgi:hypothetical protein
LNVADPGCRVVVHQLADDAVQAEFLEQAWSMVLGRLRSGLADAVAAHRPAPQRASRRKRRSVTTAPGPPD